jgi:hypothetical protein
MQPHLLLASRQRCILEGCPFVLGMVDRLVEEDGELDPA